MASYVLLLSTFMLAVNTAFAITCYNCDSSQGSNCNYGLLAFTYDTQNCDEVNSGSSFLDSVTSILPKNCIKLVGVDKEGKEYVARRCAPSTGPINTCDAIAKVLQFAEKSTIEKLDCYKCDTDKCNSAGRLSTMAFMGLLCAIFVFLF